jgi:DNA processing protein
MATTSLQAWLELRAIDGLGDIGLVRCVQALGSAEAVRKASKDALLAIGCSPVLVERIQRGPDAQTRRQIDRELQAIGRSKVTILTCLDAAYPKRLSMIPDPPPLLYVTGRIEGCDDHAVAIVGSRRVTPMGRVMTEELSRDLATAGFTIISGMARGVDAAAHRGALAAKGRTVAVLGCGVDVTYPPEHKKLREEVEAHGAVVSELPLGAAPHSYHFPRRNRIISGLSLGVVVTEAAMKSGSLITAKLAAEQGREVFAIPGSVKEENSGGPHGLIKQGAKLVERAQDVIDELLPQLDGAFRARWTNVVTRASRHSTIELGKPEAQVYDALSYEPIHVDAVIAKTGLAPSDVMALLLALELKQCVHQLPGNSYIRL